MNDLATPEFTLRVLLVEDDEGDFVITRDLLAEVQPGRFELHWARSFAAGREMLAGRRFDVVLLDHHLGDFTGLDFLERMAADERTPPVILLTGLQEHGADLAAMRMGATDYLSKAGLSAALLERSIRYAVERHRAQEARQDAERQFQLLVESVGAIVWRGSSRTLQFTYVSREAEHLLGYPVERWIREPGFWPDHMHPDDRDRALALREHASPRGEPHSFEYRMIAADGRTVWLCDIVRTVVIAGEPQLAGVMVDVTEAHEARETLRLYNRVMEAVNEGIVVTDAQKPDNPVIFVNPAFERLTGYAAAEVLGRNCRFLQGPETDPAAVAEIAAAMRAEKPVATELLNFRADGTRFWNRLALSPVPDSRGRVTHFVGVQRDVTEQKRAAAGLAAAEAHYRRLVATAPQTIYALDQEGRFTELNAAGELLTGRSLDDLRGSHFGGLIDAPELPRAEEAVGRLLTRQADTVEVELHIVRPTGEKRLVSIAASAVVDEGVVTGVHGVARDITEERHRERQVRLLASALDGLQQQGICIVDDEGRVLYANRARARLLGHDPDGPAPGPAAFLPDDAARAEFREITAEVRRSGTWSGRLRQRRLSDGTVVVHDMIVGRVQEEGRALFFIIAQDASEQIVREQHLRRVERLAGMGTLIAGVAHELNNPLSAVLGFTRLLLLDPRPDAEREDLETIAREAERMAKIVSDLRLIVRDTQEGGTRARVDLNDVAAHVLKTRAYALHTRNIEVRQDLAEALPAVLADRGQMEQLLLNLVVNAEQAMAESEGERRVIVRTRATAEGVSMSVVDSGPGIPPDQLERIFDPFFTTKPPGEGTGLGLSLVHSITREHGGEIRVESEPGKGTAFRVDFRGAPAAAVHDDADGGAAPAVEPLRVLVVDDEETIRRVTSRLLHRRGHTVDQAADGEQALRMLDGPAPGYDVIVSDLRMPGMGGGELLKRLRARNEGLERRVLFLTGDTASPDALLRLTEGSVPVLAKPGGLRDLARMVEQIGARAGRG